MHTLSRVEARRLAVIGALLSEPRPASVLETVRGLGSLQVDPTNALARAEHLVLWSRLGPYDTGELTRLLEESRELFEYRAFLVPTEDLPMYRGVMDAYPAGESARPRYERCWLAANAEFRNYILQEIGTRGPLRSRDLADRAAVPWRTGGWNDGKNLGRLLDLMWLRGEITVVARQGNERVWDLMERALPAVAPRQPREVTRWALDRQLRRCGIAREGAFGALPDGRRPPDWKGVLAELEAEGRAVRVAVEGTTGEWIAHPDVLAMPFVPRTTLLAPFDRLITDRARTEELFGFRYRLEMYVPAERREYGYYVLPILHGDVLVGRIDARFDRKPGILVVNEIWAEPDAPREAWPAIQASLDELAAWLNARDLQLPTIPAPWGPGQLRGNPLSQRGTVL